MNLIIVNINSTRYNLAINAVSQLPAISIGLLAENSTDSEFFVHVPPMQCVTAPPPPSMP